MGELIRVVQENNFVSEEALLQRICGKDRERKYYQNLKSRTLKMLQALAIVSSKKGTGEVKKKLDLCRKNFTIGQKFLGNGDRPEGLRLVKQAYRIAVNYDFVHMASELSSVLFHHHIYYERNSKLANYYENQSNRYLKAYLAEKKAEHHFYKIIGSSMKPSIPPPFEEAILELEMQEGESLKYQIYQSMIKVLYGFEVGDYDLVVKTCCGVLEYIENKKGVYRSHHQFFLSKLGLAQIATTQYADAENSFSEAYKYAHLRSANDYLLRLYRTINALHAGDYKKAYNLYRGNRKCRFELIRQQFAIIEAYLCFLSHMGYLHLDHHFRLGKYLNETFKAQSDKQGSNITILIAELLVHLARDRGRFIDRVEAVNNYSYRHLKGEDTKRAKRFIKILCLLPRANFHPIALRRVAARQIQYLEEHPIHMGENVAIEIIPFGDLLGMIMRELERKRA